MGLKSFRNALLLGATALGAGMAAAAVPPAYAQETTRSYDIQAQDLDDALREFARQTGRDILFTPDAVAGKRSAPVQGQLTERQALEALLAGTGLRFEQTASNGFAVRDPTSPTRLGAAEADTPPSEEIVVTGTRIRGAAPAGSALTTYSREDIDHTGAASLEQFSRTMTENFSNVGSLSNANSNGNQAISGATSNLFGGADFNLHGLGPGTTLTLLNGRRMAAAGGAGDFADISIIPFAVIDRIEVITDGSSAIYGSDAVAGVVNIITNNNFEGAETRLQYGAATDGGVETVQASQLFGRTWSSGNVAVSFDYSNDADLDASERDYINDFGGPLTLVPESERASVFLFGSQDLGPQTSLAFARARFVAKDAVSSKSGNERTYKIGGAR